MVVVYVEWLHCDRCVCLVGIKGMLAWMAVVFFVLLVFIIFLPIILFEIIGIFRAYWVCNNVISLYF